MLPSATKGYFPALTGLRAIAAGLVYIHHFNPFRTDLFGRRVHDMAAETHIGVTVFFGLSGFLIAYRYLDVERLSWRNYFTNRLARIYPMYFLLTTLTFIVVGLQQPGSIARQIILYGLNISLLRGLFTEGFNSGIEQGWSLTVEEMFYLSAPVSFLLIRRNARFLLWLPLVLGALGCLLVVMSRPLPLHGFFGSFDFLFHFTYPGRAIEFFVGVALAWWLRQPAGARPTRYLTYTGLAGMLLCLWGLSLWHGANERDYGVFWPAGMFINNVVLPGVGIGPLLWGLLREDTWLRQLLSSPLLVLLGKSSYVFYLIHMGVIQRFLAVHTPNPLLQLLLLIGLSVGLYKFVEEPLNGWLRRRLRSDASVKQIAVVR